TKVPKTLKKDKETPLDYAPKVVPPHKVAIQIHQWTEESSAEAGPVQKICDWVIAERLLFERGDRIGRKNVAVEIPTWQTLRGHFELGYIERVFAGKDLYKEVRHGHVAVNFGQEDGGPVIVDFVGGKTNYKAINGGEDHGNMDLLLLTPEGKLVVRSSREDADEESVVGAERLHRYDTWRSRLDFYRQSGVSPTGPTKSPMGPPGG
ncbi:MAG TPA: hypothetical protein VEL76_18445, partial [Gemmataceae bacterium]|nr:hypothetical protein [Gemmataceae bacterium]